MLRTTTDPSSFCDFNETGTFQLVLNAEFVLSEEDCANFHEPNPLAPNGSVPNERPKSLKIHAGFVSASKVSKLENLHHFLSELPFLHTSDTRCYPRAR